MLQFCCLLADPFSIPLHDVKVWGLHSLSWFSASSMTSSSPGSTGRWMDHQSLGWAPLRLGARHCTCLVDPHRASTTTFHFVSLCHHMADLHGDVVVSGAPLGPSPLTSAPTLLSRLLRHALEGRQGSYSCSAHLFKHIPGAPRGKKAYYNYFNKN